MSNLLQKFEEQQLESFKKLTNYPKFSVGDTINIKMKVGERFQNYEGVCIAISNSGINSSCTVRKVAYGEGVEKNFPLYSPHMESIEIVKYGKVRRSKLYYLKDRLGKSAKISEDTSGFKMKLKG